MHEKQKETFVDRHIGTLIQKPGIKNMLKNMHVHFLLIIVAFIWGSSFIATEIVLKEVSILTLLIFRLSLASIVFLVVLAFRSEWKTKINRTDVIYFFIIGILSVSVYQLIQITANKLSNASITAFFISSHPVILTLFGILIFREKLNFFKSIGIISGFIGSIVIASKGKFTFSEDTNYLIALLCVILNSIMWGSYSTLAKKISVKYSSFDVTALMTVLGLICFIPIAVVLNNIFNINIIQESFRLSFEAIIAILYLSIICTFAGYTIWLYCINKMEISKAGYYLYLEPIFTVLIAPFFVGNQLKPFLVIGGIFILIGMIAINIRTRSKAKNK